MKRWTFLAIAVGVAIVFARLGVWQLDRLGERRTRVQWFEAQFNKPPVAAAAELFNDSLDYRRVAVSGRFDFTRELIVVAQSYRGVPGVQLVTPLQLGGLGAVLVERGWVPSPDAKTLDHEAYLEADSTRVAGVLIRVPTTELRAREEWPRYVRFPSPEALAESYPYRLATYVIRRTELPSGAPNDLRALPPPELNNGPHLSYAVQWFSFALVALVGAVILVWHGDSKTQRREGPPTP